MQNRPLEGYMRYIEKKEAAWRLRLWKRAFWIGVVGGVASLASLFCYVYMHPWSFGIVSPFEWVCIVSAVVSVVLMLASLFYGG